MVDEQIPLTLHLEELRKRLMIAGGSWLLAFFACYSFAEPLFLYISEPLREALPESSSLVFLTATEPFFTYLKIAAMAALLASLPVILWQVWAFVAPGLFAHEKKYAAPFVIIGSLLFVGGGAFSLKVVTPYAISFLLSFSRPGLTPMISIGSYIDFLVKFTLAFAIVFELPLAITLAARLGLVTPKALAKNRKYAVLGAFVTSAILTPTPDAFNQMLMAGPLILLYEIGIISARIFSRRAKPAPVAGETSA